MNPSTIFIANHPQFFFISSHNTTSNTRRGDNYPDVSRSFLLPTPHILPNLYSRYINYSRARSKRRVDLALGASLHERVCCGRWVVGGNDDVRGFAYGSLLASTHYPSIELDPSQGLDHRKRIIRQSFRMVFVWCWRGVQ